jgi:hypothetical protein
MCYGYGLREDELNNASPKFVALFLQGQIIRESEQVKAMWMQARFIASTMSKEASKVKFPWERSSFKKVNVPDEVWEKFTLDDNGVKASAEQIKKVIGLN